MTVLYLRAFFMILSTIVGYYVGGILGSFDVVWRVGGGIAGLMTACFVNQTMCFVNPIAYIRCPIVCFACPIADGSNSIACFVSSKADGKGSIRIFIRLAAQL